MSNLAKIAQFLTQHNIAHSSVTSCVWGGREEIMKLVVTHLDKIITFTNAFDDRVYLEFNDTEKVTVRVVEAIDYIKSIFALDKPAPTPDDYQLLVKRLNAIEKHLNDMDKRIADVALLAVLTGGLK